MLDVQTSVCSNNLTPRGRVTKLSAVECVSDGIQKLSDAPGGGYIASIRDPEGFPVNFTYGHEPAQIGTLPEKLIFNDESSKPRLGKSLRFEPGPAAIHKVRALPKW